MKNSKVKNDETIANTTEEAQQHYNSVQAIHNDKALHDDKKLPFDYCGRIENSINNYLHNQKEDKHNVLEPCDEKHESCSCNRPTGATKKVDLVVLIDSSGSMSSAAVAVAAAAKDAINAAAKECPSDLRVVWLAVDGKKPGANASGNLGSVGGTSFTQTHQQYLEGLGITGPFQQDALGGYPGQEGADAIADICNFFDWRASACKSVFYISDTALDGTYPPYDAPVTNAVAAAITNGVVLFAHKIILGSINNPAVKASYDKLTVLTGGSTYHGPVDKDQYVKLLKNAICNACGAECKEVKLPEMKPCVSISWGDSDCDCFETDDVEIAMISICNCYSNISFSNVRISYLHITMADGSPVPLMPDGTPSVQIIPVGPICFGTIEPCREGATNCVSREVVIRTRGAKSGKYKIYVQGICYEVVHKLIHNDCFELELCKD